MKQHTQKYFIIDFDSTFVKSEGLEDLAEIVLKDNPDKENILNQIKEITKLGMEGKIPFQESLTRRLEQLNIYKNHIEQVTKKLKKNISLSIKHNKAFFKKNKNQIYIISGGFKEYILPITSQFGIDPKNVFANTFVFDKYDKVVTYDKNNLLARLNGKVNLVKSLHLRGDVYVIGDGYTDYQIREMGQAKHFTAFTENVERSIVTQRADHIAPSFDEFLYVNKLPMSISYPKNRIKVLLLENIHETAVSAFEKEGYSIEYHTKSISEEELVKKIKDVYILAIRSRTQITPKVLQNANRLMSIGAFCIGTDQINLHRATKEGIAVFNAPYSNTRSVVELTLGEIIMLERRTFDKSTKLHNGIWDKTADNSNEIRGKKLGIVGYGNIGSQLSVLAEAMGMEVYFYDIVEKLPLGNAKKCKSMEELLKKCDIVTIHVDGNKNNKNLIGEKEFRTMKDNVIFLNLSRGFIVDLNALLKHIKNGKIRGAGIDVFPYEPKSADEPFVSELQNLPNVILTPHIGGSTEEAQYNIADYLSSKIIEYINTGNTYLSVNLPNIRLPEFNNAHRLLHLHNNVPGILAQINNVFAKQKINILGQYLKTNEEIGYVITDVNKKYDKEVLNEMKKIPSTIRFRVLY